MTLFLRILIISSLGLVVACTPRGVITLFPEAALVGQVRNVFVGTTRGMEDDGGFNNKRTADVSFHRYDISVPPQHEVGEINWPRGKPNPAQAFLTTRIDHFNAANDFTADLAKSLHARPKGQREVVVFIHGFNNNFAEGLYRLAQLSHDMDLPNPTVHYSWPSAANPLGYGYDRDSLLFARDGLEDLLRVIKSAGADRILLVGHSMGALLTMETLRQMAISDPRTLNSTIGGVFLISPDIDVDLFRQQAARIGPLPQPFVIFTSKKDRALRLSARLAGKHERLGNVQDVNELSELRVTLIDVTSFSDGLIGHFNTATSPALIQILKRLNGIDAAFRNDRAGRAGLLPGTVLTVQQATQVILSPVTALAK
ncbi:MAG: alpha/beta fold hydrolase [Marinosulfonomonas sp.]|nr:alpha/beta fold hydrolase [Marinosulfonomonas sp.]